MNLINVCMTDCVSFLKQKTCILFHKFAEMMETEETSSTCSSLLGSFPGMALRNRSQKISSTTATSLTTAAATSLTAAAADVCRDGKPTSNASSIFEPSDPNPIKVEDLPWLKFPTSLVKATREKFAASPGDRRAMIVALSEWMYMTHQETSHKSAVNVAAALVKANPSTFGDRIHDEVLQINAHVTLAKSLYTRVVNDKNKFNPIVAKNAIFESNDGTTIIEEADEDDQDLSDCKKLYLLQLSKNSRRKENDVVDALSKSYLKIRNEISSKQFDPKHFLNSWPILTIPKYFFFHAQQLLKKDVIESFKKRSAMHTSILNYFEKISTNLKTSSTKTNVRLPKRASRKTSVVERKKNISEILSESYAASIETGSPVPKIIASMLVMTSHFGENHEAIFLTIQVFWN